MASWSCSWLVHVLQVGGRRRHLYLSIIDQDERVGRTDFAPRGPSGGAWSRSGLRGTVESSLLWLS